MSKVDTSKLRNFASALGELHKFKKHVNKKVANAVAKEFLKQLKANWLGQTSGLEPLAQAYKAAKGVAGLDERILIATSNLLESLETFEVDNFVVAGIKYGTRVEGSSIDMTELMAALEYGVPSANLPSRPIFRLTLISASSKLQEITRTVMRDEADKFFRSRV